MKKIFAFSVILLFIINTVYVPSFADDKNITAQEFSELTQEFASEHMPGGLASGSTYDKPLNRLIVKTESNAPLQNTYGAYAKLEGYNGIHILQYRTEIQTQTALNNLLKDDIIYAEYDIWVKVCDDTLKLCYCANNPDEYWCRCSENSSEHGFCYCKDTTASDNHLSWNSTAARVDEAFDLIEQSGITCKPVTVAVFDTGIFVNHDYFDATRIVTDNKYSLTIEGVSYNTKEDGHFHGTHIAGIIHDNTMNNVKICPYRIYGDSFDFIPYSVYWSAFNASIYNIIEDEYKIDVISISSIQKKYTSEEEKISDTDQTFEEVLNDAVNHNIVVVCCAGNDNRVVENNEIPASLDNVITVSATTRENVPDRSYSNFGEYVDISAPGTDIYSTVPIIFNGEEEITNVSAHMNTSGTSMATPLVSAAAATLKSIDPDITPAEVKRIIKETAYVPEGWDFNYGAGIVDFYNMVKTALRTKTEIKLNSNDKFEIIPAGCIDAVYYTLDGTDPTPENGLVYSSPLDLRNKTVSFIKAASYRNGEQIGETATYKMFRYETIKMNYRETEHPISSTYTKKIRWKSADPNIATVDSEGNIKAVGVGETQITAKLSSGKRIIYNVKVEYSRLQWFIMMFLCGFLWY